MKAHLSGKKHKKKCGTNVKFETGVPTWPGGQPPPKKIKLEPVIAPSSAKTPAANLKAHELLEKQAEEAYEKYKSLASKIPLSEAQALYSKYKRLYIAYQVAYQEHNASK